MHDARAENLAPPPITGPVTLVSRIVSLLTPWRCRLIFAALLAFGMYSHWQYLTHDCPINLSGDEAHYWDWSRQLDLSYYSKGPLVAYLIRASCSVLGETMPAVRFPAMVLAVGTACLTYWLIVRLFKSDRLALGMALLMHFVPAFIAGSLLMTIDPPFFFFWGLSTCFAVLAVLEGRRWAWIPMGLAIGLGVLAKYAMFLWFAGFAIFLLADPPSRRWFRSPWLWIAVVISIACSTPIFVWNARHGWITARHIDADINTGFKWVNPLEMVSVQALILGLGLTFMLVAGVAYTFRKRESAADPNRRALLFLVSIGLTYFAICFLNSFRSKIQPNWPAPAYFTLLIVAVYFVGLRLRQWARYRWWWAGNVIATVIFGILLMPVAHDASLLYDYLPRINKIVRPFRKKPLAARELDPSARLRGWAQLGQRVGAELAQLPPGSFAMSDDYQRSSELAFYVPGQPKTYYCGSYYAKPRRFCQFDMWPDRSLDPATTTLLGKDCVLIGFVDTHPELVRAFGQAPERRPDCVVTVRGKVIASYPVWVCRDFKGMTRPNLGGEKY